MEITIGDGQRVRMRRDPDSLFPIDSGIEATKVIELAVLVCTSTSWLVAFCRKQIS